jgi:Restriction endonuclease XhoI
MELSVKIYHKELKKAIELFWETRNKQAILKSKEDQGSRSAVTGGKQLDGFINLLAKVALDIGVPQACIYTKQNKIPGYFRPTKDWDLIIVSPINKLISVIELKSQVGSFGNNFNNRTEEALGSAVDLWTAFREKGFPQKQAPWLGYLMLVEKTIKSSTAVKIQEPHFKVRPEFNNTSYIDRYALLCQKLMLERHYTGTCLIWSSSDKKYGMIEQELSFDSFLLSFMGHLQGKLAEFK